MDSSLFSAFVSVPDTMDVSKVSVSKHLCKAVGNKMTNYLANAAKY